jgi:hypothetical protein
MIVIPLVGKIKAQMEKRAKEIYLKRLVSTFTDSIAIYSDCLSCLHKHSQQFCTYPF